MSKKTEGLFVGVAEIEITPPIGTMLAGSVKPRISTGIDDPLYVKTIVLESMGRKLAYVIFDLIALEKKQGDKGIMIASEKTGIPPENIVWAASHTHTGPYTTRLLSDDTPINNEWLATIPEKMAECIISADKERKPARFCRLRSFHNGLCHNRRIKFKNGTAINTWLLPNAPSDQQPIGSAGPIDPEIGIFSFDDENGKLMAVMFHFTLHTNTNFGPRFSADYPAVVAARIRERFGPGVITLFIPGACGDINLTCGSYRQVGDALAEKIIPSLEIRKPEETPLYLKAKKCEITVPRRDFTSNQIERILKSGWDIESQKVFIKEMETMSKEGKKQDDTILQTWCIGNTGFASLPGEIFVEWGLKIKRESPFSYTYPVEIGGDYLGYLITEQAWEEGGYEALIAQSAKPSAYGVKIMVEKSLEMLENLHKDYSMALNQVKK